MTACWSNILHPVQGESLGGGGWGSLAGPEPQADGAGAATGPGEGAAEGLKLGPLHPLGPLGPLQPLEPLQPLQPFQPLQPLGTTQQVLGAALQTIRGSSGSLGTLVQDWDMQGISRDHPIDGSAFSKSGVKSQISQFFPLSMAVS